MQKERIDLEKIRRRRKLRRWVQMYGNYAAAAGIFVIVATVVVILAASFSTKAETVAATPLEATEDRKTATAGIVEAVTEPQTYESMIYSYDWDAEEAEMLMKIAMAEAEGESTEGKAMVMLVVLNRVWSKDFPGSIEEVIFQTEPARQFTVTKDGGRWYTTEPDADCMAALQLVESGWDESNGALYFESGSNDNTWHSRNLQFLFQLGNHKFYK